MTLIREVVTVEDTISYEDSLSCEKFEKKLSLSYEKIEKIENVQPGEKRTPEGLYCRLSILKRDLYER